jgi:CMP/dCMP kinase
MFNIAIDGPSASGKSTIAKLIAKRLGFTHIDTGAMYRAIAYDCIKKNVDLLDEAAVVSVAKDATIELLPNGEVFLNGMNVTRAIRSESVSAGASSISKYREVRERLVELQREIAKSKGFVMDGRDITSVVLKDAEVKVFQTADVAVRAKRRYDELLTRFPDTDYQAVLDDLVNRDYQDTTREESPLIKVDDAIEIDTSYLTIEESVDMIMSVIKNRGLV